VKHIKDLCSVATLQLGGNSCLILQSTATRKCERNEISRTFTETQKNAIVKTYLSCSCQGCQILEKSWIFFAVLESP